MNSAASTSGEFAIRLDCVEALFARFDARPIAERSLDGEARLHLLDQWEHVREARPATLTVYAPATERLATDEQAVGVAVRADLRTHTRRLHYATPLVRRERIGVWAGVLIFLLTIAASTLLDRVSSDVLIVGISQGIVVIGWVALWDPAQRVAGDIIPHHFARKRYAEFADIQLRFAWQDAPEPGLDASPVKNPGNSRGASRPSPSEGPRRPA
jgi:hypothetical protein